MTVKAPTAVVPPEYVARDVREWAIANGYPQLAGRRGRIPAAAVDAYVAHRTAGPELLPAGSDTPGASIPGTVPPLTSSPEEERDGFHPGTVGLM